MIYIAVAFVVVRFLLRCRLAASFDVLLSLRMRISILRSEMLIRSGKCKIKKRLK